MKCWLAFVLTLGIGLSVDAPAEPNSLPWFTVAGGGGVSSSARYSLSGTTGQWEAGAERSTETYSLVDGFWAGALSFEIPDGPTLMITLDSNRRIIIEWSPSTAGYVLQESSNLPNATWIDTPSGSSNPAVLPATSSARYYRLHKP